MRIISGPQLARQLGGWRGAGSAYVTLADAIALLIQDGRLPLEARLPAERELATALRLSRTTVSAAYQRLRADGYLHSRRGSGSVVTRPDDDLIGQQIGWVAAPTRAGVLDLAIAALPASQPALDRAARAAVELLPRHGRKHGYDPAGLPELRAAVADRYTAAGIPTTAAEILITNGAQHGLDLLVRLLCRPGERVLVEGPTYPNALAGLAAHGCRVVPVALGEGDGDRGDLEVWDTEMFADTMRQSTPALSYLIPDFHNPTGQLMPGPTRAALAHAARRTGSYLVADESFIDLGLDGVSSPGSMAGYDGGERVICLGSLSKSHWGGLRVGWIRASAPLIRRLADTRAVIDMSQPVLEQLVGWQLLLDTSGVLEERRVLLAARRDALVAALRATFPAWSFTVPRGGLALWVRLEAPISSALAATARRHDVVVAPGPRFGAAAVMESRLRIPYTLPEPDLREAVARLALAHGQAFKNTDAEPGCRVA